MIGKCDEVMYLKKKDPVAENRTVTFSFPADP
jgi:hypothetical protein